MMSEETPPFKSILAFMLKLLEPHWEEVKGFSIGSNRSYVQIDFPLNEISLIPPQELELLVTPQFTEAFALFSAIRFMETMRQMTVVTMGSLPESEMTDTPRLVVHTAKKQLTLHFPAHYLYKLEMQNYAINEGLKFLLESLQYEKIYDSQPADKPDFENFPGSAESGTEANPGPGCVKKVKKKAAPVSGDIRNWVASHPVAKNPREMNEYLSRRGYIGQTEARKRVCTFAYRHLRRIHEWVSTGSFSQLPPKPNLLMSGPTGCGKTFLLELIFKELLELPMVIIDCGNLTETGLVGKSVYSITRELQDAADCQPGLAQIGLVVLDEFDKLASSSAGTNGSSQHIDVKGYSVQRELLKLIEGSETDFRDSGKTPGVALSTRMVPFVAAGVFASLGEAGDQLKRRKFPAGFGQIPQSHSTQDTAPCYTRILEACGFLPELIGRFTNFAQVEPLAKECLKEILQNDIYTRYQTECAADGITLTIEPDVMDHVLQESLERNLGARGLGQSLHQYLDDALYDSLGADEPLSIHLCMEFKRIVHHIIPGEEPHPDSRAKISAAGSRSSAGKLIYFNP
jgi:ATP-dependent Clp protease ATP-binding subunit ClpX